MSCRLSVLFKWPLNFRFDAKFSLFHFLGKARSNKSKEALKL
jgi:hypothetical protein